MGKESGTILVVDDNPKNLDVLFHLLSAKGFATLCALNGESALRCPESGQPDLIVLDIMMPGMDGFDVCRRLKANEQLRQHPD
jgi:CheY-like chemotaxis protein